MDSALRGQGYGAVLPEFQKGEHVYPLLPLDTCLATMQWIVGTGTLDTMVSPMDTYQVPCHGHTVGLKQREL